jgi:hypothetical protein
MKIGKACGFAFVQARVSIFKNIRALVRNERGSLTILSMSLFFLMVVMSFAILNTSSAMLAKRELIQIGEVAITRATHNLDVSNYYAGTSLGNGGGKELALPINCSAAFQTFMQQISLENLRSHPIGFSEWSCDGIATSAKVTSRAEHLLRIPFMSMDATYTLSATISAHNRLRS